MTDHYSVTFVPSGHTVRCPPDRSILDVGLDGGVNLPFSCRSGICRTCRGRLVDGSVDVGDVHAAYLTAVDRAAGFIHLCQAKATGDCTIEIREIAPDAALPVLHLPSRVLAMKRLAPDVMALQLGLPCNEPMKFRAGQYIDIETPGGLRRSYSIAIPPPSGGTRRLEIHIRSMRGGHFTEHVFQRLKAGDLLNVVAPQGSFGLRDDADRPMILVCSGTGFAPMKSIIEHSLAKGLRLPIHLYWGGRQRPDLYLDAMVREWVAQHDHIHYVPVLSEATPACGWTGRVGFVHQAVLDDWPDLAGHDVYACGVPVMVEAARRDFTTLAGLPDDQFFADSFVSEADRAANLIRIPELT